MIRGLASWGHWVQSLAAKNIAKSVPVAAKKQFKYTKNLPFSTPTKSHGAARTETVFFDHGCIPGASLQLPN